MEVNELLLFTLYCRVELSKSEEGIVVGNPNSDWTSILLSSLPSPIDNNTHVSAFVTSFVLLIFACSSRSINVRMRFVTTILFQFQFGLFPLVAFMSAEENTRTQRYDGQSHKREDYCKPLSLKIKERS